VNTFVLWIAQGFGSGRIPVAPGTFGSLVGLLWFALLLLTPNLWCFLAGALAGLAASVWLGGVGERILGQKDPGSVVIDEIAAMPLCFIAWLAFVTEKTGSLPPPAYFFLNDLWPLTLGVFATFRFFDVVKPWPVRRSQSLPGGWGVTIDDALAAAYVNLLIIAFFGGRLLFGR
jgi:phosphatidylglycerophosphatase A